jgi:hypothetical protein
MRMSLYFLLLSLKRSSRANSLHTLFLSLHPPPVPQVLLLQVLLLPLPDSDHILLQPPDCHFLRSALLMLF